MNHEQISNILTIIDEPRIMRYFFDLSFWDKIVSILTNVQSTVSFSEPIFIVSLTGVISFSELPMFCPWIAQGSVGDHIKNVGKT